MQKGIIASLLLYCFIPNSHSQPYSSLNDDYNYIIEKSVSLSTKFHSAIRPYNLNEIQLDSLSADKLINCKYFRTGNKIFFSPVFESIFLKSWKNDNAFSFSGGGSFKALISKNWYCQLNLSENINKFPDFMSGKIDSNQIVPHFGKYTSRFGNFYSNPFVTGLLQYSPATYLSLATGIDRNFIGDGYRSMLLSDNTAPYPFAQLSVNIWRLKYIFLYTFFHDIYSYSGSSKFYEKHAVIHFLSYNVSDRLNLGFFEAIIWRNDSSNRAFEPNYINPMIFLRPVEFSLHSPDNANLGGLFKVRFWKRTFIYGQLFLDDLIIKQLIKNSGWWGNKYGFQAGFKCFNFMNCSNLFLQAEVNFARPYTYSHETSLTNYGNAYQPLAHPLGANFREFVTILRYSKNRWLLTFKSVNAIFGEDTSSLDFGGNIYKSYASRIADYNIPAIQGLKTRSSFNDIKFSYFIFPKWNMCAIAGCNLVYRKNSSYSKLDNYFYVGISTLLYNNASDY